MQGEKLPAVKVEETGDFNFEFPLNASSSGHYEIALELDHSVVTPPDKRPLGLVFGTFEIRCAGSA